MTTRVLIVEDSPTQAEALRGVLEDAGYAVTHAATGEDGLARAERDHPGVVISDVVMPGAVDGYELCRRIKAGARRDTPVMLLTSLTDPMDIIRGLECGADNFVTKPYDPDHLIERLEVLLATRQARKRHRVRAGIHIVFMGREFSITSEREQILDLLVTTFEEAVRQNRQLQRADAELRRTEALNRAVLESAIDGITVFDEAGLIQSFNPAAERIFGWKAEEIIGRNVNVLLPASDGGTGAGIDREVEGVRKDGTRFPLHLGVSEMRVGPQRLFAGITRDIRAQKVVAEELERARDVAEKANRAKSAFLAKMSHELRTPLNSIIGFSEVLVDGTLGSLNERQQRYVSNVLTSGRALLNLINDILDLSKVEAGRLDLALGPVNVAASISEVMAMVAPLAERKQLRMSMDVEARLPPLAADGARLRQVLINLLSNAIKFTLEGGRVRVNARRVDGGGGGAEAGEWIEVAVTDTGIGIAAEDQERIFGEFEQVNAGYAVGQEGTGLGLALTRRLVEVHGGHIGVESAPGTGSTFRFALPLRAAPNVPPAVPSSTRPDLVPGPHLLVVDDEPGAAALLSHYFTESGYAVTVAETGDAALDLARRLRPDAITLDILLPDGDGLRVIARLKSDSATRHIPIIVVSVTDDRSAGLSLGAAEWFVKPVSREDLLAALRRVLERPARALPSPQS